MTATGLRCPRDGHAARTLWVLRDVFGGTHVHVAALGAHGYGECFVERQVPDMWRCLYGVSGCRFTCALAYYSRGHIGFFKRYDVRNGEYTTRLREHGLRVCWFWRWYCCRCIARRLSLPCDCAYAALPSAGLCAFERLLLPLASRFVCLAPVLLRRRGGLRHQWFHAVRDACERLRSSNAARCCAKLVCGTSAGSAPASGCCATISVLGTCCVTAGRMRDACFVKKGEGLGAR